MKRLLNRCIWLAVVGGGVGASRPANAQDMPRGAVLMAELGQGFNYRRGGSNALYLATLQVVPQWTLVPGRLRAGLVVGAFYPGTRLGGLAGGRVTLKVLQGRPVLLAGSFHVHVLGEYLPAVRTGEGSWQQWLGGGVGIETSNLLSLAVKLHRDLRAPVTYGQLAVAFNLLYKRNLPPEL